MAEAQEPKLPQHCPICGKEMTGIRASKQGRVALYPCGAEVMEGRPPKMLKDGLHWGSWRKALERAEPAFGAL